MTDKKDSKRLLTENIKQIKNKTKNLLTKCKMCSKINLTKRRKQLLSG